MSIGVLFVCLGNICRSPMAEGILRQQIAQKGLGAAIQVDSCGTAAFNVGKSPDPRAISATERRGINISQQIARQIDDADYAKNRYLVAMDRNNLSSVQAWAPTNFDGEIKLLMDYLPRRSQAQVADPYYSEAGAFDQTLEEIERGTLALLEHICAQHAL